MKVQPNGEAYDGCVYLNHRLIEKAIHLEGFNIDIFLL